MRLQHLIDRRAPVFALALAADWLAGDPPTPLHPVGWLGRAINRLERCAPVAPAMRRRFGIAVAFGLPTAAAAAYGLLDVGLRRNRLARVLAAVGALDAAFALHTLLARAGEVAAALEADDLGGARRALGDHLVSRETADLSASEVAGAAIESVAENLGDSVVAPWLAFTAAGAAGAIAYRAVNTLDAMWGYRSTRYRDLGLGPARLDDVLNWLPARVTAGAICLAAAPAGADARGAFRAWHRDAGQTESPNAGHPMAAMAGALGVTLAKRGQYRLGAPGREASAADLRAAIRVAQFAALAVAASLVTVMVAMDGSRG